jgi:hypothetical protein
MARSAILSDVKNWRARSPAATIAIVTPLAPEANRTPMSTA